jgi:hypothetical protein
VSGAPADKVVVLPWTTQSDAKAAWLDQVAQCYDRFAADYGHEPTSLVFVALSKTNRSTSWYVDKTQSATATILYAAETLRRDAYGDY